MNQLTLTKSQNNHLAAIGSAERVVLCGHALVEIPKFTERLATSGIKIDDLAAGEVAEVLGRYAQEDMDAGKLKLAGDVVNAATYLNRLPGANLETIYAGSAGTGALGKRVTEILESRGIKTMPYVNDTDCPVGIYGIEKTKIGGVIDNKPHYARKGSERDLLSNLDHVELIVAAAKAQGIFYTSLIPLGMTRNFNDFERLLKRMRDEGVRIFFDTNYREHVMEECFPEQNDITPGEAFLKIAPYINLLSSGRDDMPKIFPALVSTTPNTMLPFLHNIHCADTIIALKSGADGTFALNREGSVCNIPTPDVAGKDIVDTTGGGDSWNARLIDSIGQGEEFPVAIANASQLASNVIQRAGAVLSRVEINAILAQR